MQDIFCKFALSYELNTNNKIDKNNIFRDIIKIIIQIKLNYETVNIIICNGVGSDTFIVG